MYVRQENSDHHVSTARYWRAGLVEAFLKQGYTVVATALDASESLTVSSNLVPMDGDIGKQRPLLKLSKQRSSTSGPSMFW
jgi:hypothetical protein